MRVLHVLNSANGGASIGALELMRASRQANSGIEHFIVYPGLNEEPDPMLKAVCSDLGTIPMRWWNSKSSLSRLRRMAVWVREMQLTSLGRATQRALRRCIHQWKIDLVHTNTAATDAGAIAARSLGLPHIWHIRECIGRDGFMRFNVSDIKLVTRLSALSDAIVPMSRFVGNIFCRQGAGEKVEVVYDGVNVSQFETDEARLSGIRLRHQWGVPDGAVLIAKVAAVSSQIKRHDLFIRAAGILGKQNPAIHFAIIGAQPTLTSWSRREGVEYYDRLRRLVTEEGIADRFHWIDSINDICGMMNAIDILAHACELEGFGRVAIEAMAAGKPVVGPAAGGLRESVVDGETGLLVNPGDFRALAAALERLVSNPGLRKEYGRMGRRRALTVFSLTEHLQAMQRIYHKALVRAGNQK